MDIGVADGARTHDNRNHNPGLYQLSYSHRKPLIITAVNAPNTRFGPHVVKWPEI